MWNFSIMFIVVVRLVFDEIFRSFGLVSGLWKSFCMVVFVIVSFVFISIFSIMCGS